MAISRAASVTASRAGRGFTAAELLVTVSILAILAAVATPSLTAAMRRTVIASAANEVHTAVIRARLEAQRAGQAGTPFTVCASSTSATPATAVCAGAWTSGLIVFADANGNGSRELSEPVVYSLPAMNSNVSVSVRTAVSFVLYTPGGLLNGSHTGMRMSFTHARLPVQADVQHLCVMRSGVEVVRDAALQSESRLAACRAL
jgi:prepilin-type N-terminal cleavage/methylation domain-containing protein